MKWALKGEPLQVYGNGSQTRCFCNVSDTVRALIALAECDESVGEIVNVGFDNQAVPNHGRVAVLLTVIKVRTHLVVAGRLPNRGPVGGLKHVEIIMDGGRPGSGRHRVARV